VVVRFIFNHLIFKKGTFFREAKQVAAKEIFTAPREILYGEIKKKKYIKGRDTLHIENATRLSKVLFSILAIYCCLQQRMRGPSKKRHATKFFRRIRSLMI
jgi:hypothetical protein